VTVTLKNDDQIGPVWTLNGNYAARGGVTEKIIELAAAI